MNICQLFRQYLQSLLEFWLQKFFQPHVHDLLFLQLAFVYARAESSIPARTWVFDCAFLLCLLSCNLEAVHWTRPLSQEFLNVSIRFITGISQLYENGMLNHSKNKLTDVHAFYKSTYYYNCSLINHVLLCILFLILYFDYLVKFGRTEDEVGCL
jgi:hypothetical protein